MIALNLGTSNPTPGLEPAKLMLQPHDVVVLAEKSVDGQRVLRVEINGRPYAQVPLHGRLVLDCTLLEGGR